MTNTACNKALEPDDLKSSCGWIYTIQGTRKAHHVYCNFMRDLDGKPIKHAVIPAVSRQRRASADLVSTCLWHPVQGQLYLYAVCIDIDKKDTLRELLTRKGSICAVRLRATLKHELPRSEPYIKLVKSTNGEGIHAWLFFPAFALDDPRNEKQRAMAHKITLALKHVLRGAGYAADENARGLHHLYANWRNPEKHIDKDIIIHQAAVRRATDKEYTQYNQVLSVAYYELAARPDCRDIFTKALDKPYRSHAGISRKIMTFIHANYDRLKSGESLSLRASELIEALGISKNTLPRLLAAPVGMQKAPTEGIVIERDLLKPGYYLVSRGYRFDSIRPQILKSSHKPKRKGTFVQSIDVGEALKHPENVRDGERHHEAIKAILKLKLHGVEVDEAKRIMGIYSQRAIKDSESTTLKRINYFIDNAYAQFSDNKGKAFGIAPNWLLTITSTPYPKSLKGALKSREAAVSKLPRRGPPPPPGSRQTKVEGWKPGDAEAVGAKPFKNETPEPLPDRALTAFGSLPFGPQNSTQPLSDQGKLVSSEPPPADVIPITRRSGAESWTGRMSRIISTAVELPRSERDRIFQAALASFRDPDAVSSLVATLRAEYPAIDWPSP